MLQYFTLILVLIIVFKLLTTAVQYNMDSTEFTIFECRFESNSAKVTYSLQFFTLALSFIAFDFEIFLLLPFICLLFHFISRVIMFISVITLLTILLWVEMKYISTLV